MKRLSILLGCIWLAATGGVTAQVAVGGTPRIPLSVKAAVVSVETMPAVSNERLRWESRAGQVPGEEGEILKPLRFAHTFETAYSPATHGMWMESHDGWRIWQMRIHSPGAYSLNLLFDRFSLPHGTRLFLFTPGREVLRGAYTDANNDPGEVFTITPLPGDEITVHYECPPELAGEIPFVITAVNHDFLGILKYLDERRPMGVTAEACNRDVACSVAEPWSEVRNSVCRIMIQGRDLCTGTLVNNTAGNQKPYILTANHCISTSAKAAGSLFLFNYESPYCGPLDGDVTNSLSGSQLRATLDSLDFALVELNTPPPPVFRPYFAGWNRDTRQSDTTATIHHPQGDIKKIAVDHQAPVISSFLSQFTRNAFLKVLRWDVGTTEIGSSGGPLFDRHSQITGTLSGGAANCANPVNDYFARFDLAWNYKPDSARQLRYWLDPAGTNAVTLSGRQFNQGEALCKAFTPMEAGDTHLLLAIRDGANNFGGYWTGTNNSGISEMAARFSIPGEEIVTSVSLGVGKLTALNPNSFITLRLYNFAGNTATPLTTGKKVLLRNLFPDAMNLIPLDLPVQPGDSFLVSVQLGDIASGDTLALYQSNRSSGTNSLWLLKNGTWSPFSTLVPTGTKAAPAMEIVACNVGLQDTTPWIREESVLVYPNPAASLVTIRTREPLKKEMVTLHNALGQEMPLKARATGERQLELSVSGFTPGLYVISVRTTREPSQHKIMVIKD